jgi:hypothetical protein
MTTFTSEDRLTSSEYFTKGPWPENPWSNAKDYRQAEIEFFWPLTQQIPLDLDYGPTHLYHRAKGIAGVHSMPIQGSIYEFTTVPTTWSTNIAPTLSVHSQNSVGQLNIGGISVGLENEPKWYSKLLYKLLGFNWKK